jgi:hypothetical protein
MDANQLYLSLFSFKNMQTKNRDRPNNITSVSAESAREKTMTANQLKAAAEMKTVAVRPHPQIRAGWTSRFTPTDRQFAVVA